MVKMTLSVVAGLLVWVLLITVCGAIMRAAWPQYAAVAEAMTFTLPMLFARLAISTASLLAAAGVTAVVAAGATPSTIILGSVLLVAFVPIHIGLWDKFPVWYHLTFLLSLIPLSVLGGRLGARSGVASAFRLRSQRFS
jgi:hypothetical protein